MLILTLLLSFANEHFFPCIFCVSVCFFLIFYASYYLSFATFFFRTSICNAKQMNLVLSSKAAGNCTAKFISVLDQLDSMDFFLLICLASKKNVTITFGWQKYCTTNNQTNIE